MPPVLQAITFVGGAMALAVGGMFLVRRKAEREWLERHHEVAGYFLSTLGSLYAVLLAFAIFVVWIDFKEASSNVELEANQVADMFRMSKPLPEPLGSNARNALIQYSRSILEDEFPAMAEGRDSPRTSLLLQSLWNVYRNAKPNDGNSKFYYEESVKRLTEVGNYRHLRLFKSNGTVPAILWYLLDLGAVVLVALTYFFGLENIRSQMLMTAALAGVLASSLFVIYELNRPFAGVARISTDSIRMQLQRLVAAESE
jgi:Protein of unknown function (DUF4239)